MGVPSLSSFVLMQKEIVSFVFNSIYFDSIQNSILGIVNHKWFHIPQLIPQETTKVKVLAPFLLFQFLCWIFVLLPLYHLQVSFFNPYPNWPRENKGDFMSKWPFVHVILNRFSNLFLHF